MSQTLAPTKHTNVKYSLKSGAIHKPKNMKSVNNTTLAKNWQKYEVDTTDVGKTGYEGFSPGWNNDKMLVIVRG